MKVFQATKERPNNQGTICDWVLFFATKEIAKAHCAKESPLPLIWKSGWQKNTITAGDQGCWFLITDINIVDTLPNV